MTSRARGVTMIFTVPGAITVSDNGNNTGSPPLVVGGPPQWADASDGSYAELEVFEHPDVSYRDGGHGVLKKHEYSEGASIESVMARIRYQALDTGMKRPHARITRVEPFVTSDVRTAALTTEPGVGPEDVASMTATVIDLPMTEGYPGAFATLVEELREGNGRVLRLDVYPGFLREIAWRSPRMRIYEAEVHVTLHLPPPAPFRLFPRRDTRALAGVRNRKPNPARVFPRQR